LDDRKAYVKDYLTEPANFQSSLIRMLERLQWNGMNTPESDDEDGPAAQFIVCEHHWISPDVNHLLSELDRSREATQARCLIQSKRKRGPRPLPRIGQDNPKQILDSVATRELPGNWYRQDWLGRRTKIELLELQAKKDEPLPSMVCSVLLHIRLHLSIMHGRRSYEWHKRDFWEHRHR
jgi:hypothetical protein